jgi:tRNA nucleotidyltransferase/poly(A) polymerase
MPTRPNLADTFHSDAATESLRIILRLRDAGFVAFWAGGCVRDALLGKTPKDFDVATDATPDAVRDVFGKKSTLAFGASFGVIGVLPPIDRDRHPRNGDQTIQPTEVATFRSDGTYSDGRRPDSVHFGDAQADALRRDFTINGLFYDPVQSLVIDYVGGQADLAAGVLRTIGDPRQRFDEDKLRMLRAVRFATTLGFRIDPATMASVQSRAAEIDVVSGERIGAEMRRVLAHAKATKGIEHLIQCHLETAVLPELADIDLDRAAETLNAAGEKLFVVGLAALLVHHPSPIEAMRSITARWKLSGDEVRQVTAAIMHHAAVLRADVLPWSTVQPILADRDASVVVEVADALARSDSMSRDGVALARQKLALPPEQLDPPPLISGDDLRSMGIAPGPNYRVILETIRKQQLDQQITTQEEATQIARNLT